MPKTVHGPEETFFHIKIVDASLGNIRFGPFTLAGTARYMGQPEQEVTFEDLAAKLLTDIQERGVKTILDELEINFGYRVFLIGDDGSSKTLLEKVDV